MNKNDVIEYIRNNSKHPHAALIAEWLLTGCKVEVWNTDLGGGGGGWLMCDYPNWMPDCRYRLVKPKPACRVYLRITGYPATVERFPDGTYSENYNENLQWLSDWIEYEPQSTVRWPNEYIQRIAEIDQSAAQWLVDNGHIYGTVVNMFTWTRTPQGHGYWWNIYETLKASKLASS